MCVESLSPFPHVAAGHTQGFRIPTDEVQDCPRTLLKKMDLIEHDVYSRLHDCETDPIREFIPDFEGVSEEAGVKYIRIANVLHGFNNPMVMDVKLGCRTQLESEKYCRKPRPDLFERMALMYPKELTHSEREAGFVTKHRWMSTRDAHSTIAPLSFRVDGVSGYSGKRRPSAEHLASMRTMADTRDAFKAFVEETVEQLGGDGVTVDPLRVARGVRKELLRLLDAMHTSDFVASHEFIGSSILLVADGTRTGVFWIDFAKTNRSPCRLTHRGSVRPGVPEDGIISGLENLILAWTCVTEILQVGTKKSDCRLAGCVRFFTGQDHKCEVRERNDSVLNSHGLRGRKREGRC